MAGNRSRSLLRKQIKIPSPHFFVFYNGEEERPDWELQKLSDMYYIEEGHPALELEVVVLNINKGHNPQLMETCQVYREIYESQTKEAREA